VARAAHGVMAAPALAKVPDVDLAMPFYSQRERLIASFELRYLKQLLESSGGNVSKAARTSGISRVHLYALLQRHGLS
jgi:DNA-binding NtrC family response regulator